MQTMCCIVAGVARALSGGNQFTVMGGGWESGAVMGHAGAMAPFTLIGLAYGAGRWGH